MVPRILSSVSLEDIPEAVDELSKIGELICIEPTRDNVLENIGNFDAYFASAAVVIDQDFVNKAHSLKIIGSPSTGTDHLDLKAISEAKIKLFDISKEFELINSFTATSELAFGLLLTLIRKITPATEDAKKGKWSRENFSGFQLNRKTLGILGLGRLGKISARIGTGFGMRVIAHDIKKIFIEGVEMVDFRTLMSDSDVLSIHLHLDDTTRGIINSSALLLMKPSSVIINTSRGAIISETDLLDCLVTDKIQGAALDVVDGEWLSSEQLAEHPLIKYARENKNLIITPHIGGATLESIKGSRVFMAKKIAQWLKENV